MNKNVVNKKIYSAEISHFEHKNTEVSTNKYIMNNHPSEMLDKVLRLNTC